jgi:hypothetical protein
MQSRKQPTPERAITDRPVGAASAKPTAPPGGWRLSFLAGFVPLMAGLTTLLSTWIGVAAANSAWWTGLGTLDFSYSTLARAGNDAPAWVQLTGSIGGVNIVAGGVAVIVVSRFGLRGGQRWGVVVSRVLLCVGRSARCDHGYPVFRRNRATVHGAALRLLRPDARWALEVAARGFCPTRHWGPDPNSR